MSSEPMILVTFSIMAVVTVKTQRTRYLSLPLSLAKLRGKLRYLVRCVLTVTTAIIEKVTNIMGSEDINQSMILRFVFVNRFQLVTTRTEGTTRRITQSSDGLNTFFGSVNQFLVQGADNAIAIAMALSAP